MKNPFNCRNLIRRLMLICLLSVSSASSLVFAISPDKSLSLLSPSNKPTEWPDLMTKYVADTTALVALG